MRHAKLLFHLFLVVVLAGCGGSSSHPSAPASRAEDGLIGTWSGTYAQSGGFDRHGTLKLTIARGKPSDGFVGAEGTIVDAADGPGTVEGSMYDDPSNIYSGLYLAPSGTEASFPFMGRLEKAADGHLRATLQQQMGDGSVPTEFDLAPVAAQ